jgi:magnesium transporter
MALQSAGITVRAWRRQKPSRRELRNHLAKEVFVGIVLGVVVGAIAGAAARVWLGQSIEALNLGVAVASGIVGAAAIGVATPVLLARTRWTARMAAGPIVRSIAAVLALLVYFNLARWLLA